MISPLLYPEYDVVDEHWDEELEEYVQEEEMSCWKTPDNSKHDLYICHYGLLRYFDLDPSTKKIRIEVSNEPLEDSYQCEVIPKDNIFRLDELDWYMDREILLDDVYQEWVDGGLAKFLHKYKYVRILEE